MTGTTADVPTERGRLRRTVRTLLGPLWVTTFRDPVRAGRLRLDGLSWAERQLARFGIVAMLVLLGSLLFTDVWRRGELLSLTFLDDPRFVPDAFVPVILVVLFLAFTMIVWGALDASPLVRAAVALVYLATVATLGVPTAFEIDDSWILEHGPTLVRVGYWVPFGALVLSVLLSFLPERARNRLRGSTAVLRGVVLLAFATMVVAHLGMDVRFSEAGFPTGLPSLIHSSFTTINGLLIPLGFVTAVAVVDFATDVSTSLAEPVRRSLAHRTRVLCLGLVALIAVKLWFSVGRHLDYWSTVLTYQPSAIVRTVVVLAIMGAAATYVIRTVPSGSDTDVDETKEGLTVGGAVVLSSAVLVATVLLGFAQLVVNVARDDWGLLVADKWPVDTMSDVIPIVASVLSLGLGARLLRHGSSRLGPHRSRELGSGLLILGAWNLPAWIDAATELSWGFSYPTVDLAVTLGVLAWLLARWRRIDAAEATALVAVVVFAWLVTSRGDYLSFLGSLLGLPGVVVVVFGVLYTMLSGSGFTRESSTRLPRESRTLMFVGYLLLSVTILTWLEVIHEPLSPLFATSAYYFLAVPLAAWLIIRRIIPRQLGTR